MKKQFIEVLMRIRAILIASLALLSLSILISGLSGCSPTNDMNNSGNGKNVAVSTNGTLGTIMVDGQGRTLYFFSEDANGKSACNDGSCTTAWPVFFVNTVDPDPSLNLNDFGTIKRQDGTMQTTYKGWPLYYYEGDKTAGDVTGDQVDKVWFAARPDYSIMISDGQLVGLDGKNYTNTYTQGSGMTSYFTDGEGKTLYIFSHDTKNQNTFTKADFSNNSSWPIFYTDIKSLPSDLLKTDFSEITVAGHQQLTYKGWPLYYFGQDTARGETRGVSVPQPGVWPVANSSLEEAVQGPTLKVAVDATLGNIITDGLGRTLYFYSNDVKGINTCKDGCLSYWPRFYADTVILAQGSSLNSSDFGELPGDSIQQSTYKGWPLYYYSPGGDGNPEDPGHTAGDGVEGIWFAAKPDYSLMAANVQLVGANGKNYLGDYTEGTGMTKFFTDINGITLYRYSLDSANINNYTNSNFSNNAYWPIFYVAIDKLPSSMNAADFGVISVFGHSQLTFKGWPLYYFGGDTKRGDTKGVSVPSPGVWPVVNNDTPTAP